MHRLNISDEETALLGSCLIVTLEGLKHHKVNLYRKQQVLEEKARLFVSKKLKVDRITLLLDPHYRTVMNQFLSEIPEYNEINKQLILIPNDLKYIEALARKLTKTLTIPQQTLISKIEEKTREVENVNAMSARIP